MPVGWRREGTLRVLEPEFRWCCRCPGPKMAVKHPRAICVLCRRRASEVSKAVYEGAVSPTVQQEAERQARVRARKEPPGLLLMAPTVEQPARRVRIVDGVAYEIAWDGTGT